MKQHDLDSADISSKNKTIKIEQNVENVAYSNGC